jgi:electron transfer flavoprotein beta subunit
MPSSRAMSTPGVETLKVGLPAVVTVDLRLNDPPRVTLPNFMKATKKPIDIVEAADLGVDVATLVAQLNNEAKVN